MNFPLIFVSMSTTCMLCVNSNTVTTWGNVNLKFFGMKSVYVDSAFMEIQREHFSIPMVSHFLIFFFANIKKNILSTSTGNSQKTNTNPGNYAC